MQQLDEIYISTLHWFLRALLTIILVLFIILCFKLTVFAHVEIKFLFSNCLV